MKLAVVGTSLGLTDYEYDQARSIIDIEYHRIPRWEEIITGDASGIDEMVSNLQFTNGIKTTVFKTLEKHWEGKYGFKNRNVKIAESCDELVCITVQTKNGKCYHCKMNHQRTGGCWTMKYAKSLGKPVRLYVV